MNESIDLDGMLKRLHLAHTRRVYRDVIRTAEKQEWTFDAFFEHLVTSEIAHRKSTQLAMRTRQAKFPFLKTIEEFDFTRQSVVKLPLIGSALSAEFVTSGQCLILHGQPGRGKTHLAIAIAYKAILNGFTASFITAAELIDALSKAFRRGELAKALGDFVSPDVLVIDEVGYLTYGTDAANILFHVVNERHRRKKAMIFTTNKALKAWGKVLHDEDLAAAITDRVLERGRLLKLDGPSMRTRHLKLDEEDGGQASER